MSPAITSRSRTTTSAPDGTLRVTDSERPAPAAKAGGRLAAYAMLIRLNRPIGFLLLLWPTLWALWFASGGWPGFHLVAVFVAGSWLMRSAGCAINDFWDRDFDPAVERTRQRPLATKSIRPREAVAVAAALSLCAFALVLTLNRQAVLLSFAGLALAVVYPLMKRVLQAPQLVLGVAFSWGIPMAYAATLGSVPWSGWALQAIAFLWCIAYDTAYAIVDRDDDLQLGLKSTAILFGRWDAAAFAALQSLTLVALAAFGWLQDAGVFYWLGLVAAAFFAGRQMIWVRTRERAPCFRAFINNHRLGFSVFAGIACDLALA